MTLQENKNQFSETFKILLEYTTQRKSDSSLHIKRYKWKSGNLTRVKLYEIKLIITFYSAYNVTCYYNLI